MHEAEAATVIGMILAAAKDSCGDCSVPEDGKTKTTVVVEEAGGSGNAPEGTEVGAETHSGTLFPDEEVPQETGRNRHHETPQPKKQRQAVSWKKKIQKAVDKFTGTLYNMNEEMNNEEI